MSLLLIGSSTGGPDALMKLIPELAATLPVPVLLVQHMPPHFTLQLAEALDKACPLKVVEARSGLSIERGTVYIAPGGGHLRLQNVDGRAVTQISQDPPVNSCRPSVDVLFQSVHHNFPRKGVCAVVLTGMGSDGLEGVRCLKQGNCYCIAQDKESSVVYGMPRAIHESGLADVSLPLNRIASKINSLFSVGTAEGGTRV